MKSLEETPSYSLLPTQKLSTHMAKRTMIEFLLKLVSTHAGKTPHPFLQYENQSHLRQRMAGN